MADDLTRIATALEELLAIERERRDNERETRAARRQPRPPREERKPSPQAHAAASAVLRRLRVR